MPDAPETAPLCLPPDPNPRGPTRYRVPVGAVDTHAHVIAGPPDHPFTPERTFTPPPAPLARYLDMLDATGMTYGVLVQVSAHGTDNRLLVEALRAEPRRLRGIAVAPLGLPDAAYADLREAGVVGLRLNTLFGGGMGVEEVGRYGALCRELGWHLQFLIDARQLASLAGPLSRLDVPFVIDHAGHLPTSEGLDSEAFRTLVALLRDGGWTKLSGAFRTSVTGAPYRDTIPYARALAEAAPDRCLWGSDWPHVAQYEVAPDISVLLDLLADWVPDEERRHRLFVDNPQSLYGFPPVLGQRPSLT